MDRERLVKRTSEVGRRNIKWFDNKRNYFLCGVVFNTVQGKTANIRTRKNFVPHGILF